MGIREQRNRSDVLALVSSLGSSWSQLGEGNRGTDQPEPKKRQPHTTAPNHFRVSMELLTSFRTRELRRAAPQPDL